MTHARNVADIPVKKFWFAPEFFTREKEMYGNPIPVAKDEADGSSPVPSS
jgi:hypothetical protein